MRLRPPAPAALVGGGLRDVAWVCTPWPWPPLTSTAVLRRAPRATIRLSAPVTWRTEPPSRSTLAERVIRSSSGCAQPRARVQVTRMLVEALRCAPADGLTTPNFSTAWATAQALVTCAVTLSEPEAMDAWAGAATRAKTAAGSESRAEGQNSAVHEHGFMAGRQGGSRRPMKQASQGCLIETQSIE